MIQWGINALNHGSSLAVFKQREFENCYNTSDSNEIPTDIIKAQLDRGHAPDEIFWYERPWIKKARQLYARQYDTAFNMDVLPSKYLKRIGLGYARVRYTPHHGSHAAAGYYTSPFNHAAIVVLDAIGEWECASIWQGSHGEIKKVWGASYPHSLGLFYSAFTKLLGMTPIKDEHLLQRMAEQGDPTKYRRTVGNYFKTRPVDLDYNFHRGVLNWEKPFVDLQDQCDLAAAVQERFEIQVASVMMLAKKLTGADALVYMGGCALNSRANKLEVAPRFKYIWSLPEPGDYSSAIGAVAYHNKHRIWRSWGPVKHIDIKT